jgi:hypothetical protein
LGEHAFSLEFVFLPIHPVAHLDEFNVFVG